MSNIKKRKRERQEARVHCNLSQSWFGDDASYCQYRDNAQRMQNADPAMYSSWSEDDDDDDSEGEGGDEKFGGQYGYMLSKHGDVAVMQVYGEMVSKESWYNRFFGMVSYEEMRNAAIMAAEGGAKALLIDYDTGGGAVTGIGELSDFLSEFDSSVMPVYSYTGANMLSAGYWLGAVGRKVFSSSMALSGSIGVITAHFSYHRALKEQGIDVTMFRQGEYKALGSPYEQLDDKAKADIESRMGKFYDMFLGHVSVQRSISIPTLIETAAEGRVFMGEDAVKAGLVDAVTSFDKALALVTSEVNDRQPRIPGTLPTTMAGMTDMKRKLNQAGIAAVASGVAAATALVDPKLSEEATEPTEAEVEAAAAAEAEATAAAEAEAEAAAKAKVEAEPKPAATAGIDAATVERLITLSGELATAKAELTALKAADTVRDASFKSLMKICADSINRMELPLNRTASNLKDASPESLVNTYHTVLSMFNGQFKVGGVADVPVDDDMGPGATRGMAAYVPPADMAKL